jgi:hypothetical protein
MTTPEPATFPASASQGLINSNSTANSRMPPPSEAAPAPGLPAAPKEPARNAGYGLPCSKCRTYYSASLNTCPVCRSTERVSPVNFSIPVPAGRAERTPDPKVLEEERERFLQELKSQTFANPLQIHSSENFSCSREENHEGSFEPASVCQNCHDQLRTRVDLAEAALLMDPKEAAHLVYEAVWSDPSDPTKTYLNAANALLNELRRRAGIPTLHGGFQNLMD